MKVSGQITRMSTFVNDFLEQVTPLFITRMRWWNTSARIRYPRSYARIGDGGSLDIRRI